jgi:fibronectin-binding autotransporter adhesin
LTFFKRGCEESSKFAVGARGVQQLEMQMSIRSIRLIKTGILAALLLVPAVAAQAQVSTLYWDPNFTGGTAGGGSGTWNTSASKDWCILTPSGSDIAWVAGSNAVFGGSSGTVTMASNKVANNLAFNSTGYIINGSGNALTLNGGTINIAPGGTATVLNAGLTLATTAGLTISAGNFVINQTGTVDFFNGGTLNGNLVISNSTRVDFNTLTTASSTATYNGAGSIQIQSPLTVISNASGTYGGAIGVGIQLNSKGLSFTKTDVTQSTITYPASNSFVVGIGATKNGTSNENLVINGVISGNADVVLGTNNAAANGGSGAGVTQINGSNTYAGTTFISGNGADTGSGGSVILGVSNTLPATTDLVFGFPNPAPSNKVGLDLNGHNQVVGSLCMPLTVTGTNQSQFFIANNLAASGSTLTVSGNTTPFAPFAGRLLDNSTGSGGTLALAKGGTNTLWLSGANSFSGGTTVSGGVLKVGSSNALGSGGLTISSGSVDLSSNRPTLAYLSGPSGTITNSGSSSSTLAISLSLPTTFGGAITDGASPVALAINGMNSITLTGSSTYSGGTTLTGGLLVAANTAGSALGLGPLTLNGGTLASDIGSIGGNVFAGSGAHAIAPGGLDSVGTLVLSGSLTLNGNSTLDFDVAGGTADSIQIGGTLNYSSGGGPVAVAINASGILSGSYDLANYLPSGLSAANFNPSGLPPGYSLVVTPTELSLAPIAVPEPSTIALLGIMSLCLAAYALRRGELNPCVHFR